MVIGCTYDEKVFNIDKLKYAISLGLLSLEISPDLSIMPKDEYIKLIKFAKLNRLKINYHIPYFASEYYNQKLLKSNRNYVIKKYDEFFNLISEFNEIYQTESIIVYHGEDFKLNEDKIYNRTVEIIEYGLQKINNLNLNCKIAIETIRGVGKKKIGDNHEDLIYILKKINSKNLGICLDLCHDIMNNFPDNNMYSESFLDNLIYIHAHGIDLINNLPHISIFKSKINILREILLLKEYKKDIIINIEILYDFTGESFFDDLFLDIKMLNKIFKED